MPFDVRDEPTDPTDYNAIRGERHDEATPREDLEQPRTQHDRSKAESKGRDRRETSESANSPGPNGVEITFDPEEVIDKLGVLGSLGGLL